MKVRRVRVNVNVNKPFCFPFGPFPLLSMSPRKSKRRKKPSVKDTADPKGLLCIELLT